MFVEEIFAKLTSFGPRLNSCVVPRGRPFPRKQELPALYFYNARFHYVTENENSNKKEHQKNQILTSLHTDKYIYKMLSFN